MSSRINKQVFSFAENAKYAYTETRPMGPMGVSNGFVCQCAKGKQLVFMDRCASASANCDFMSGAGSLKDIHHLIHHLDLNLHVVGASCLESRLLKSNIR